MTEALVINATVRWVGEHWILRLRRPNDDADCAVVHLYHTHYSPAGTGHVALVSLPSQRYNAICTDNSNLAEYVGRLWLAERLAQTGSEMPPVVEAEFVQSGDLRDSPGWRIRAPDNSIDAVWSNLQPPVTALRPDPAIYRRRAVFNILYFANSAQIKLNGQQVEGSPYRHDLWRQSIGGEDRSSCVFALAEAFVADDANLG